MTPQTRRNLYVDAEASPQAIGIGMTLLLEESRRAGSGAAWLVCPQQTQLDESSQIGEILGKQIVDRLRKRQPVQMDSVQLVAYTERQLPHVGKALLCWSSILMRSCSTESTLSFRCQA